MSDIKEDYFLWLCDKIKASSEYSELMRELHAMEFVWTVANDDNRAMDGMVLRDKYAFEKGIGEYDGLRNPCSLLEMMIGLSIRCENDIMWEPDKEDESAKWFWSMIRNVGWDRFDDVYLGDDIEGLKNREELRKGMRRVVNREYESNGKGGLFPLKNNTLDCRSTEIWYQLAHWLDENYPFDPTR